MVIRGQYRVIRTLECRDTYAAVLAVDIMDREKPVRLLNIYEGISALKMASVYQNLRHCPGFLTTMMNSGSLIAVFEEQKGTPIVQAFQYGARIDWRRRLAAASALFQLALRLSDLPPEIACQAFYNNNLLFRPGEQDFCVSYVIEPAEGFAQRELICLLGDQIFKILPPRWGAAEAERLFLRSLYAGKWDRMTQLFSAWREAKEKMEREYTETGKKGFLGRSFRALKLYLKYR